MIIAVDTGGTKTLVARLSEDGAIMTSHKFPTPRDITEYIAVLTNTIAHIAGDERPDVIVVALPGIVKNDIGVWCANLEWKNIDIRSLLQPEFHHAKIIVENDANLAGLGETHFLKDIPTSSLYVTISTGIGTGLIEHGQISPAMRHSEGGHMQLEFDDESQAWEHFSSGKAIYETYGTYARDITDTETWTAIVYRFSVGFLALIPLIQPDVIIIGGSLGTYFERYESLLRERLLDKLPPHIVLPEIRQASHPEEAVIYGCYHYASQRLAK
jgi:predicted NBD/HSP70 family sugar kinase